MSKVFNTSRMLVCLAGLALASVYGLAQTDPGPRGGAPGAGQPIAGLAAGESYFFVNFGSPAFNEVEDVADGLGPRFNLDSCAGCHIHPAVGGSSPPVNPQFTRASIMAPGNTIPSFITQNGPVREVRFIKNPDGSADGGVHAIFTIAGRSDKPANCNITQPNFAQQVANNNAIFRIPTPTFGLGLIEAITDTTIRSNLASDPGGLKAQYRIGGHVNTNGNDGTVTRFGWKAQNKSLAIFSAEAYSVEMGVSNEGFSNEREEDANCAVNGVAESDFHFLEGSVGISDAMAFRGFMRFLDQPTPACSGSGCSTSIQNGRNLFATAGCALCHTPSLTTGASSSPALNHKQANLYSDLAVHHMGANLADGVTQGSAGPDEFRTAPLWGLGQRIFFLHDGRTSSLLQAIQAHASPVFACVTTANTAAFVMEPGDRPVATSSATFFCGSEANTVIGRFNALNANQKQDMLNFLRSL